VYALFIFFVCVFIKSSVGWVDCQKMHSRYTEHMCWQHPLKDNSLNTFLHDFASIQCKKNRRFITFSNIFIFTSLAINYVRPRVMVGFTLFWPLGVPLEMVVGLFGSLDTRHICFNCFQYFTKPRPTLQYQHVLIL